jgi:hypothetical protein
VVIVFGLLEWTVSILRANGEARSLLNPTEAKPPYRAAGDGR